jgi:hypothetical protein
MKSERQKKLEIELQDLVSYVELDLYPKYERQKLEEEIQQLKKKIEEEVERIRLMKENGDVEEFVIPKRNPKQAYADASTLPDIDMDGEMSEGSFDSFETTFEVTETGDGEETESGTESEATVDEDFDEDEDWMSQKAQLRRLGRLKSFEDDM